MRTAYPLLRNQRQRATMVPARMSKWKFKWYKSRTYRNASAFSIQKH